MPIFSLNWIPTRFSTTQESDVIKSSSLPLFIIKENQLSDTIFFSQRAILSLGYTF